MKKSKDQVKIDDLKGKRRQRMRVEKIRDSCRHGEIGVKRALILAKLSFGASASLGHAVSF
jgi:hypothetical protein